MKIIALCISALTSALLSNSQNLDSLHKFIFETFAIDNDCHILCNQKESDFVWDKNNPLGKSPYPMYVRLRTDNSEWIGAWKALYDYPYNDMRQDHLDALLRKKRI